MKNRWEEMYDNFKLYFPVVEEHTTDCYCSGPMEMTIWLDDGRKLVYDDLNKTIRYLKVRECQNIDENEWKAMFSENIYRILKNRNMTRKELSELTGISQSGIGNILRGKTSPNSYNIRLIADALECTVSELFDF